MSAPSPDSFQPGCLDLLFQDTDQAHFEWVQSDCSHVVLGPLHALSLWIGSLTSSSSLALSSIGRMREGVLLARRKVVTIIPVVNIHWPSSVSSCWSVSGTASMNINSDFRYTTQLWSSREEVVKILLIMHWSAATSRASRSGVLQSLKR